MQGVTAPQDFGGRRAPYAPISALEKFLERMRERAVPDYVDHRFLRRMSVASNNEYSLLSALKFLGILDDRGRPTHAYRQLLRNDSFQETLRHLVETAYKPVFEAGADRRSLEDLVDFFRAESSPSQAKNAARFFLAVCRLAGIGLHDASSPLGIPAAAVLEEPSEEAFPAVAEVRPVAPPSTAAPSTAAVDLRTLKARLVEKLPASGGDWSPETYRDICQAFASMLESLDRGCGEAGNS
jgi:AcrR family transcriptional regulator